MDVTFPCICGRHDSDVVTLRDTLDFRSALAIRNEALVLRTNDPDASIGEVLATLTEQYILFGVEAWTLADEHGKKLPVSRENIRARLLAHPEAAIVVADAADSLYGEKVVLPLLLRASKSSPPSPTDGSTSATNGGSTKRPKRSSPSSTASTPTDGTAPTTALHAGASSS